MRVSDSAQPVTAGDLLDLPGVLVTGVARRGAHLVVAARLDGCPVVRGGASPCPGCRLKDHRTLEVADLPLLGRPCRLSLTYSRRRCIHGNTLRVEFPPQISRRHRVTRRLAEQAALLCLRQPTSQVARQLGMARGRLSALRDAVLDVLNAAHRPRAPEILGIDEAHIHGRTPLMVTDLVARRVIGVAPVKGEATVRALLAGLRHGSSVRAVVIDMHPPYRRAVREVLPGAVVVVDKRHVLEMARRRLMSLRAEMAAVLPRALSRRSATGLRRDTVSSLLSRRLPEPGSPSRRPLMTLLAAHPPLAEAYRAKEAFYALYDSAHRSAAEAAYARWCASLTPALRRRFSNVLTTVEHWREEIFAYFDVPERPTAGFTEAANRRLKEIARESRGKTRHHFLQISALHRLGTIGERRVRAAVRIILNSQHGGSTCPDAPAQHS